MANHKSAEKRNRQRLKRRARNVYRVSTLRTYMKRVRKALAAGNVEEAEAVLPKALSAIGKAASKGAIHRNTAARYASRIAAAVRRARAAG